MLVHAAKYITPSSAKAHASEYRAPNSPIISDIVICNPVLKSEKVLFVRPSNLRGTNVIMPDLVKMPAIARQNPKTMCAATASSR